MSKEYLLNLLKMPHHELNIELEIISISDFKNHVRMALKEQDRDTRHACAESVINSTDPHSSCMNCNKGLEDLYLIDMGAK